MDFELDEVQQDVRSLAKDILDSQVTPERLKELEKTDDRIDRQSWQALADAGLLGIALPESVGGSGQGLLELAVLLEQVGRHVVPVPALATLGWAAPPIARFGTAEQQEELLAGVAEGSVILTAGFDEVGSYTPGDPATTAEPQDGGWALSGSKIAVPWLPLASRVLVTARTPSGSVGLFVVPVDAPGVTVGAGYSTNRHPSGELVLESVHVDDAAVVGDPTSSTAADWAYDHALAAQLAVAIGVVDQDLQITARYDSERLVFGRPIATFQAAAMRLADSYIDTEAIKVTAWAAIWRFAQDLPARDELALAKWWVADGGQRVVHAGQHLHGGTGVDIDYPLHRYFLWAKDLEVGLGGAAQQAMRLGSSLVHA